MIDQSLTRSPAASPIASEGSFERPPICHTSESALLLALPPAPHEAARPLGSRPCGGVSTQRTNDEHRRARRGGAEEPAPGEPTYAEPLAALTPGSGVQRVRPVIRSGVRTGALAAIAMLVMLAVGVGVVTLGLSSRPVGGPAVGSEGTGSIVAPSETPALAPSSGCSIVPASTTAGGCGAVPSAAFVGGEQLWTQAGGNFRDVLRCLRRQHEQDRDEVQPAALGTPTGEPGDAARRTHRGRPASSHPESRPALAADCGARVVLACGLLVGW